MKLNPKRSEASIDGDDWLATMRSAWRSGIERDERDEQAASARRLARVVTPEARESRPLRDVLPFAVCVGACVLAGIALHHSHPDTGTTNEIRADEEHAWPAATSAPADPPSSPPLPVEPAAAAAPSPSTRPAPVAPPKAKSETLPPLPPPDASSSSAQRNVKRFQPRVRDRLREMMKGHPRHERDRAL